MTSPVTVSGLVAAHRCPLRFWNELDRPPAESVRYAVAKQVAAHLGDSLEPARIWDELTCVLPGVDPGARALVEAWTTACREIRPPPFEQPLVRPGQLEPAARRHGRRTGRWYE